MKLLITVSQEEDRAVRSAAYAEGRTISDFLRARIFAGAPAIGGESTEMINEIRDLQRVSISILARFWSEHNPKAAQIIQEMMRHETR